MFNGLPVLSVVLVCSIAFFGCVTPNRCKALLQEVEAKAVSTTCFRRQDVKFYLETADLSCQVWADWPTLKSIEVTVAQRACKLPCEDVFNLVDDLEPGKTCNRHVDYYLELAAASCSDSRVDWVTHKYIKEAIVENACQWKCEDFLDLVAT